MRRIIEQQFSCVGEYPDERRVLSWLPAATSSSSLILWAIWIKLPVLRFAINGCPGTQRTGA